VYFHWEKGTADRIKPKRSETPGKDGLSFTRKEKGKETRHHPGKPYRRKPQEGVHSRKKGGGKGLNSKKGGKERSGRQ